MHYSSLTIWLPIIAKQSAVCIRSQVRDMRYVCVCACVCWCIYITQWKEVWSCKLQGHKGT